MVKQAVDFNQMRSKRYQTFRIISAPGIWSTAYRQRLALLSRFRTAILFPEMVLGLNQARIFTAVEMIDSLDTVVVAVRSIAPACIRLSVEGKSHRLESIEQLLEFELAYNTVEDSTKIYFDFIGGCLTGALQYRDFVSLPLFCNKEDVIKYASERLVTTVKGI